MVTETHGGHPCLGSTKKAQSRCDVRTQGENVGAGQDTSTELANSSPREGQAIELRCERNVLPKDFNRPGQTRARQPV